MAPKKAASTRGAAARKETKGKRQITFNKKTLTIPAEISLAAVEKIEEDSLIESLKEILGVEQYEDIRHLSAKKGRDLLIDIIKEYGIDEGE